MLDVLKYSTCFLVVFMFSSVRSLLESQMFFVKSALPQWQTEWYKTALWEHRYLLPGWKCLCLSVAVFALHLLRICFLVSHAFIGMEQLTDWSAPTNYIPWVFPDQVLELLSFIYNWHEDHFFFKHLMYQVPQVKIKILVRKELKKERALYRLNGPV